MIPHHQNAVNMAKILLKTSQNLIDAKDAELGDDAFLNDLFQVYIYIYINTYVHIYAYVHIYMYVYYTSMTSYICIYIYIYVLYLTDLFQVYMCKVTRF
jgi:hypothetical protein